MSRRILTDKQKERILKKTTLALNELVQAADSESALNGLRIVAVAFGLLLDTYASPNPENPEGMCDNPVSFRRHFADIISKI